MEVHTTVPVYNGVDWPSKSHLRFVKIDINGEPGEGFNEFEYRNDIGRPDSVKIPPKKIFFPKIGESMTKPSMSIELAKKFRLVDLQSLNQSERQFLVVPLSHRACQSEELVGGKGKQLAQLYSIQSSVSTCSDGISIRSFIDR